jgi:hypothetical protein
VIFSFFQILGEGKPENQNQAMIFCFSESLQTVDMNQENHLAEAFKMRNLLQARLNSPSLSSCYASTVFTE